MKHKFLIFFFTLMPLAANAQDSLKDDIIAAGRCISSIECDFTQTKHSSLLASDVVSTGRMKYAKPDFLEWRYLEPIQYAFLLEGKMCTMERDGKSETFEVNRNRMASSISKLILGNIDGSFLSERAFKSDVSSDGKQVSATLLPTGGQMKSMWTKLILHYRAGDFAMQSIELYETNGDTTVITFSNSHYGFTR